MDWDALNAAADTGTLKRTADLRAVAQRLGIDLEPESGYHGDPHDPTRRWVGRCPWHSDRNPSLAVYWSWERGHQRVGCWPCGRDGDVFDLIQWSGEAENFSGAKQRLIRWLTDEPDTLTLTDAPDPEDREPPDFREDIYAARDVLRERSDEVSLAFFAKFAKEKAAGIDPDWLIEQWALGVGQDAGGFYVSIPHSRHAVKVRRLGPAGAWSPPLARAGSDLASFYGSFRDTDRSKPVVLVEGESDVWSAAWWLGTADNPAVVLGLPSGADSRVTVEALVRLEGREVTLVFDADEAGERASARWTQALREHHRNTRVSVARLPEGMDVRSAGPQAFLDAAT